MQPLAVQAIRALDDAMNADLDSYAAANLPTLSSMELAWACSTFNGRG